MIIKSAEFTVSNTEISKCPEPKLPEYAFIGRSNVGKSSLINMLTNNSKLAKTSQAPGKTRLINHFLINNNWYVVDLPGYGFAKTSKSMRESWQKMIAAYMQKRTNLMLVFVLIDSRIPPQRIDIDFINWLGQNGVPLNIVFTKTDKINQRELSKNINLFKDEMLKTWEEMPVTFISSAKDTTGRDEILSYIEELNPQFVVG